MPNSPDFIWLFFKASGRIGRAAYALSFLFMLVVVSFPLYQFMRLMPDMDLAEMPEVPLSSAAEAWSMIFMLTLIIFLWGHIVTSIKRLHDLGRPGIMAVALFIPVVSVIAFVVLCAFPGEAGPNRYGQRTNAPA